MELPALIAENVFPIGPRILLEVWKQADKTSAGLELAEGDGFATPTVGRVFRTGNPDSEYKIGDCLMWRRYGIDAIKISTAEGDVEFYLLEENEVIARVSDGVESPARTGNYSAIEEKQNVTSKEATKSSEENSASEEKV